MDWWGCSYGGGGGWDGWVLGFKVKVRGGYPLALPRFLSGVWFAAWCFGACGAFWRARVCARWLGGGGRFGVACGADAVDALTCPVLAGAPCGCGHRRRPFCEWPRAPRLVPSARPCDMRRAGLAWGPPSRGGRRLPCGWALILCLGVERSWRGHGLFSPLPEAHSAGPYYASSGSDVGVCEPIW